MSNRKTEKYILPFETNVELRSYLINAYALGALKACLPNYNSWLCNKMINCYCRCNPLLIDTTEEDLWSTKDGCTFDQVIELAPATFAMIGLDLITFNISMLQNKHYISGHFNERYIPGTRAHKENKDFNHRYIIFGYDYNSKTFKAATYLKDCLYQIYDIKQRDYINATLYNSVDKISLHYYKINPNYTPVPNIKLIKSKLENYIYSRSDSTSLPNHIYGINAWKYFAVYLKKYCDEYINLHYTRVFMEHHGIMFNRLTVLTNLSFIKDNSVPELYHKNVYIPAQHVFNMSMKYNVAPDSDLLLRIIKTIDSVNKYEHELLHKSIQLIDVC